jgi:SAM-dependent methyltransferase
LDIPTINVPPELIKLLEPDETFYRFLLTHYPEYACLRAPVEEIPLPDETVDTVLSSLVLCSVQNLAQALQEIYRVLVPGGQFLFLEHVAHEAPAMRRLQHRINPLWGKIGGGCQLDRPVISALREQGFDVSAVKQLHRGFLIPVIQGRAVKPRPLQNPQETPH